MEVIRGKKYPGRGIIIGTSEDDKDIYVIYFIMGRSENSRNRIFSLTEDGIQTEAYQAEKLEDPSLIIYHPVRRIEKGIVVSNGDQTDTICEYFSQEKSFIEALESRTFEPDSPHFTPRISAWWNKEKEDMWLSIIKAGDQEGKTCVRQYFHYPSQAGKAYFLHTYEEGEEPLKSFTGEPRCILIHQKFDELAKDVWDSLDSENKISLYACCYHKENQKYYEKIMNKNW